MLHFFWDTKHLAVSLLAAQAGERQGTLQSPTFLFLALFDGVGVSPGSDDHSPQTWKSKPGLVDVPKWLLPTGHREQRVIAQLDF